MLTFPVRLHCQHRSRVVLVWARPLNAYFRSSCKIFTLHSAKVPCVQCENFENMGSTARARPFYLLIVLGRLSEWRILGGQHLDPQLDSREGVLFFAVILKLPCEKATGALSNM